MAKWYIDVEFSQFRGKLLSLAMIKEDASVHVYAVLPWQMTEEPQTDKGDFWGNTNKMDPWVRDNVLPVMYKQHHSVPAINTLPEMLPGLIQSYLKGDPSPVMIADWPDDLKYFADAVVTGPGTMIDIPNLTLHCARVDAYPTLLQGAVQHNAWWDAMALLVKCENLVPPQAQQYIKGK